MHPVLDSPPEGGPDTVLTAEQAAEVARRHGLSLQDAAALRVLADDPQVADRIAGRFAATNPDQLTATEAPS
jgi:hypothetical protein